MCADNFGGAAGLGTAESLSELSVRSLGWFGAIPIDCRTGFPEEDSNTAAARFRCTAEAGTRAVWAVSRETKSAARMKDKLRRTP